MTLFMQAFVSGVGCNWLVCLAVWMNFSAEDVAGKIFGIWFPIMAFVAIGFQHVVANMFVKSAAIFAGEFTWLQFLENTVAVFLGNAVGGAIFVGGFYWVPFTFGIKRKLSRKCLTPPTESTLSSSLFFQEFFHK